ncbi:MAG: hypothetical protein AAF443_04840 [Chlamydiota bacterium]
MSSSAFGTVHDPNSQRTYIAVGSGVSCNSCSASCGAIFTGLKWSECDSIVKVVGFLIGGAITFVCVEGYKFVRSAVQLFYLDKVGLFCFRQLGTITKQCLNCINACTDLVVTLVKKLCFNRYVKGAANRVYNHILTPIGSSLKKLLTLIFKQIIWDYLCVPLYERVIYPVIKKAFPARSTSARVTNVRKRSLFTPVWHSIKCLSSWTITPICKYIISPAFNSVINFFYALLSGALVTPEPNQKQVTQPTEPKEDFR